MRTREEIAWAAGLFEGEGYISLSRYGGKQRPQLVLGMSQVDPEPMQKFVEALGIGVAEYVEIRTQGQQNIHRYRIVSFEKVQAVIAMLWPWLSRRRKDRYLEVLAEWRDWVALTDRPDAHDGRRGVWRRTRDADGRWHRVRVE